MSAPRLDGYSFESPITSQGRSVTLRAKRDSDGRPVIVTMASGNAKSCESLRQQLRRERDILTEIKHPGLPTLLDYVDECPALVTEDVGGFRLSQVLAGGPLDVSDALAITIELCTIVNTLHRHDIIHGVIGAKLVEITENGGVYLHGCSAPHPSDDLRDSEEMAPEQLLDGAINRATDVFLVGSLLYRMLTNDNPFAEGSEEKAKARPRVLRRRVHLSRQFGSRALTKQLDQVLTQSLQKRNRERFADMAQLEIALSKTLRSFDTTPHTQLVRRAVARAGLGDGSNVNLLSTGLSSTPTKRWRSVAALGAGILVLGAGIATRCSPTEVIDPFRSNARGIVKRPAELRFLAQPWAEVYLDGRFIDVTPIGRTLQVAPGAHLVEFKHPHAPTQVRNIELIPEQVLVIDIAMPIAKPSTNKATTSSGDPKPPDDDESP